MLKEKLDGRKDLQTKLFRWAWLVSKDYLPADLRYNEVTWGCWGRPNISDMKLYTDIIPPYNNRVFLDL